MSDIAKAKIDVEKIIKKSKNAMLATIDEEGFPNVRAMLSPRKIVGIKEFWFTTNTSSNKVSQIRANEHMSIYFYDKKLLYHGVMLLGKAQILEDETSKKEIWKFGDTMYYKKGVTDPDYCVIKFTAEKCKYYHAFKQIEFEV